MPAALRIELFPASLPTAIDFYTRIMHFTLLQHRPDEGYAFLQRDAIYIGLDTRPDDPAPLRAVRKPPTGVEIVIMVDDVVAERRRIVDAGWALDDDLKLQDWGLTDFRICDPFGYYLRITEMGFGNKHD